MAILRTDDDRELHAEYGRVCGEARKLARLLGDVDFTVGKSLPISGLTAWQGLFGHCRLQAGQSVLLHGAAGGIRLNRDAARTWGRRLRHRHWTRCRPSDRARVRPEGVRRPRERPLENAI
jgi:hypothetical protein